MMHKWKILFWLHWSLVVLNAVALMWFLIPVNSWFVMPCIIVTAMSVAPIFFSVVLWKELSGNEITQKYLNTLMLTKSLFSVSVMLLFYAWFWWSMNVNALLLGSVMTSWLGNAVFWFVRNKDLAVILPECTSKGLYSSGRCRMLNDTNPTTGLPMYGGTDAKGNFYGAPHYSILKK